MVLEDVPLDTCAVAPDVGETSVAWLAWVDEGTVRVSTFDGAMDLTWDGASLVGQDEAPLYVGTDCRVLERVAWSGTPDDPEDLLLVEERTCSAEGTCHGVSEDAFPCETTLAWRYTLAGE